MSVSDDRVTQAAVRHSCQHRCLNYRHASPASAPTMMKPRMRSPSASTKDFMKPRVSEIVRDIGRSVAPHSPLRRRISRTLASTLFRLASVPRPSWSSRAQGPSARRSSDHHPKGWPVSNRNGRDQIGIGCRFIPESSGRLAPESARTGTAEFLICKRCGVYIGVIGKTASGTRAASHQHQLPGRPGGLLAATRSRRSRGRGDRLARRAASRTPVTIHRE